MAELREHEEEEDDVRRRRKLPVFDGRLTVLESVDARALIRGIPAGLYHRDLTYLVLNGVALQQFPKELYMLTNLTRLEVAENSLTQMPADIHKLASLTHLDVSKNKISNVPLSLLDMTSLCTLSVKDNLLTELPQLNVLPTLTVVKANRNHLNLGRLPPGLTAIMKSFGAQHVPSEIEPGLYLGAYISAQNLTVLQALRITHILTVARETPPAFPDKFVYKHIKEDDLPSIDLSKYFDEMADFIAKGKAAGGVLVHCRQGISRSATAIAAYLIKKRAISYDGAIDWLRTARQCVNPNSGFRKQLRTLYRECRRLRTPPLPGAPEPVPEPLPEAIEEEPSDESKERKKEKKEKKDKERKERRSSREVKREEDSSSSVQAQKPIVVPELDITGDPRKRQSDHQHSKDKKEKDRAKDKEHRHKSSGGSKIRDDTHKAKPSNKDSATTATPPLPPPSTGSTRDSTGIEATIDVPPPPRPPMAGSADAAPHVIVADKSNAAAEDELRAKLRAEVEAQVRQELEAQWNKELADREAKIRAAVEAELRAMYGKEAPLHTIIELSSPTADAETDPLIGTTKTAETGLCSWCSIV